MSLGASAAGVGRDSLQREALHTADPQLVVHASARQRGHVNEEELHLTGGTRGRLAQGPAHVGVGVLPLVSGHQTGWGTKSELQDARGDTIRSYTMEPPCSGSRGQD